MSALSEQQIERLIELLEERLLRLSSDGYDDSPEYRELQACRYALIAMAATASASDTLLPMPGGQRPKAPHLRPIPGGKV